MSQTVLIADDHAAFRSRARVLLELEGYDVVGEAVDGTSAFGLMTTPDDHRRVLAVLTYLRD